MTDSRFPIDPSAAYMALAGDDDPSGACVVGPGVAPAQDPALVALTEQVRSGAIRLEEAVERLVDRAATAVESTLGPAQSAELRSLLRDAVLSDPWLSALVQELGGQT